MKLFSLLITLNVFILIVSNLQNYEHLRNKDTEKVLNKYKKIKKILRYLEDEGNELSHDEQAVSDSAQNTIDNNGNKTEPTIPISVPVRSGPVGVKIEAVLDFKQSAANLVWLMMVRYYSGPIGMRISYKVKIRYSRNRALEEEIEEQADCTLAGADSAFSILDYNCNSHVDQTKTFSGVGIESADELEKNLVIDGNPPDI